MIIGGVWECFQEFEPPSWEVLNLNFSKEGFNFKIGDIWYVFSCIYFITAKKSKIALAANVLKNELSWKYKKFSFFLFFRLIFFFGEISWPGRSQLFFSQKNESNSYVGVRVILHERSVEVVGWWFRVEGFRIYVLKFEPNNSVYA